MTRKVDLRNCVAESEKSFPALPFCIQGIANLVLAHLKYLEKPTRAENMIYQALKNKSPNEVDADSAGYR